ncbi:MAG: glycosyltransferase family 4 protein [Thermoguttaceae bacterium]|jgi:glycosyltransferase involved in cell wall biosynthesis|nr:glycosyltransferase family 4 protein [Thermoguttaceae bacterium]
MRIAIVNQFYPPDAAPTGALAASLAEHRARCGDEVTVVTSRGGYVTVSHAPSLRHPSDRLKVHRVWTPRLGKRSGLCRCLDYLAFFMAAAWRLLCLPRQDVVVAMTTPPFLICAALLHKLLHPHTRLILWNMDCYPEVAERDGMIRAGGWISRALRALNRAVLAYVDRVVCLDPAMAALLEKHYGSVRRPLPVSVIPNWEPLEVGSRDRSSSPLDRQVAERLDGKFVVLYTGNRGRGHHFATVLDAAEALRGEPVCFCFVGGGSQTGAIRQAIVDRYLTNVILMDYVPGAQLRALLSAAHCALITLREEMLGVMSPSKLHVSLAFGLPVLYMGPAGSNVDLAIKRFGCGASLRPGDLEAVLGFLRHAVAHPEHMASLRVRARRAFEEAYCDARTLPQFDALLTQQAEAPLHAAETLGLRRAA